MQTIRNPVHWSDIRRDMTPAERFFACCLSRGERCRLGSVIPEVGSGKNSIRSEVIRFFAYGGDEAHPVLGSQIRLQGAWVHGELDLSFSRVSYALLFYRCHFGSVVNVIRAECPALYMSRVHLDKGLKGDGLRVGGGMFMRNGFSAKGEVRLVGATIEGNLNCVGGRFANPGKNALIASHAKVKGGAFLCRKFSADGEVRLIGANIGENLNCADGTFSNEGKRAFSASRIKTGGDIMLTRGFFADGEVRLRGASIGGQFDCAGGHFNNPGDYGQYGQRKYALNAERIRTGGHVYLNKRTPKGGDGPFIADGRVRFANANIGGNFNCKGGQFRHSGERSALAAGGLMSRAVFLSKGFSAKGEVALHVAHIGNFVCTECNQNGKSPITINLSSTKAAAVDDDEDSWKPFKFILDGFTYDTFYGQSPTDSDPRLKWLAKRPEKQRLKNGEMADLPFSPLPYEQAAKVLFRMGRASDARKILLEKERLQTADARMPLLRKIGRGLWDIFAGYGYRLRRTLYWMVGFVGLGALLFACADYYGRMAPHQPVVLAHKDYKVAVGLAEGESECLKAKRPTEAVACLFPGYPKFHPLVYSADVFIPFFALHQEPYWYPNPSDDDRDLSMRFLLWWYWIEIAAGWLLTSLFLLSVTGLLRPRQSSGGKD